MLLVCTPGFIAHSCRAWRCVVVGDLYIVVPCIFRYIYIMIIAKNMLFIESKKVYYFTIKQGIFIANPVNDLVLDTYAEYLLDYLS